MKKLSLIALLCVLGIGVGFAQKRAAVPGASFKKVEHNFGKLNEEIGSATTVFEFTNIGKSPIIIQRVSASCGCTMPTYSREPILPGKKGNINVRYSTVNRPGNFTKTISVYTNVPDTVYVLRIKGTVIPKK